MKVIRSNRLSSLLIILFAYPIASLSIAATNPMSIATSSERPVVGGQRSVFMNGVDVSSSRNEDLRNVHLRIDEHGNIFITAPHYQVTESETFTPLSSYHHRDVEVERQPLAERKPATALNQAVSTPPTTPVTDSAIAQPVPVKPVSSDNGVKTVMPERPASSGLPK
jgi:hypothetical protein